MSFKILRVQQLLLEEINTLIVMKKIKDPRVNSHASVMSIRVSGDTNFASVFVSGYLSQSQLENTVDGLNNAKGFIQREIAKKFKLKNTPKLTFKISDALEGGEKVLKHIDELSQNKAEQETEQTNLET